MQTLKTVHALRAKQIEISPENDSNTMHLAIITNLDIMLRSTEDHVLSTQEKKIHPMETDIPVAINDDISSWNRRWMSSFYLRDKNSGYLLLVDTGARMSLTAPDSSPHLQKKKKNHTLSMYPFQAANGKSKLNFGLMRPFPWIFIQAQRNSILAADFLSLFLLLVHITTRSSITINTKLTANSITSLYISSGISFALPTDSGTQELLKHSFYYHSFKSHGWFSRFFSTPLPPPPIATQIKSW